jgi:hypothetical protein
MNWLQQTGGRRFVLTIGCGIATTALVWFGKINGEIYSIVTLGTVGAYIAGNTYQKVKGAVADSP